MVLESYVIGTDRLWDDSGKHDSINRTSIDVRIKVGWVKGMDYPYFLYQAYDYYWDFSQTGLYNDTHEVVIDGDMSGGPLIDREHWKIWTPEAVGAEKSAPDKDIDYKDLSQHHTMYGNASHLCKFRLMPYEPQCIIPIEALCSFKIIDIDRRIVAFKDESVGRIFSWRWDFGDGTFSTEQHPVHQYSAGADYIVMLYIEGHEGNSRLSKVWDVSVR